MTDRIFITDKPKPFECILTALTQQLPFSLPLLRRLQFMNVPGGHTATSHILSTFDTSIPSTEFAVVYLDFSRGPETELWLYSTIERYPSPTYETVQTCTAQILALLAHVRGLEKDFTQIQERETPGTLLVGTLHKTILQILEKRDLVKDKTYEHFKFIFEDKELPPPKPLVDETLCWGVITVEDIPLVLLRTEIPRKERTLKLLPSIAIRIKAGPPIAWAFLGPDGSLTSLHCEPAYRGTGLAKAVALRLFRKRNSDFTQGLVSIRKNDDDDDAGREVDQAAQGHHLAHADVGTENLQSKGVCKSLGGKAAWSVYWAWIDISRLG